jgi:transposase-like protein
VSDREGPGAEIVPFIDDRWRQAWRQHCKGETNEKIAKDFDVTGVTIAKWIRKYSEIEQARDADFGHEKAVMLARLEQVARDSYEAYGDCESNAKVKPEHMANVLKAIQMEARLRGMDLSVRSTGPGVQVQTDGTEILIRVGGQEMVRGRLKKDQGLNHGQAVEVPSRDVPAPRGTPGSARAAIESKASDRDG